MIETPTTIHDVREFVPAQGQDTTWKERLLALPQPAMVSDWLQQHARTLWYDRRIVAMGGVQPLWPGVAELWFSFGELAFDHPVVTMRHLRFLAQHIDAHFKFHRVQCLLDLNDLRTRPLLERMGYRDEGVHPSYYLPGHDYLMLARVTG